MFKKTIEALQAAKVAAQEDLDALVVPPEFDAQGRQVGGGFHWHAAGSGLLQNLIAGLDATLNDFAKRQANQDATEAAQAAPAEEPTTESETTDQTAPAEVTP